jgi:hypothetical protein
MQPQYSTLVGLGDVGETCHAYPNSMFLTPSPGMSEKQGLAGKSNGGAWFFSPGSLLQHRQETMVFMTICWILYVEIILNSKDN